MGTELSLHTIAALWNSIFHSPDSPLSLAIFRIFFGLLLTYESIGLLKWGSDLFGTDGLALTKSPPMPGEANIFSFFGGSDSWVRMVFVIHTLNCVLVTVGLFTRIAALLIFVNFASRMKQNWFVIQGADNLAKFLSLLMIFSNAGALLSVDSLLHLSWTSGASVPSSQWAQRLMQIQVSIVYLRTVLWKLKIYGWIDGTAVFHAIYKNPHYRRKTIPALMFDGPAIALMTWATLLAETAGGTLLWLRETRYLTMAAVVGFHVSLEVLLKLKYFQLMMIVCLLLFVPSEAWMTLWLTLSRGTAH